MTSVAKNPNKAKLAYSKIKKMLLNGEITTETFVSEEMFSKYLGLSRTPVREAIKLLLHEGYFRQGPSGGLLVHKASLRECRELYDLRIAMEEYVMIGIPMPLSEKNEKLLQSLLEKQRVAVDLSDTARFLLLDIKFHTHLFEIYGNAILSDMYQELRNKFIAVGLVVFNEVYTIGTAYSEHCNIVEALKSGSNDNAALATRKHIMHAQQQLFSVGMLRGKAKEPLKNKG